MIPIAYQHFLISFGHSLGERQWIVTLFLSDDRLHLLLQMCSDHTCPHSSLHGCLPSMLSGAAWSNHPFSIITPSSCSRARCDCNLLCPLAPHCHRHPLPPSLLFFLPLLDALCSSLYSLSLLMGWWGCQPWSILPGSFYWHHSPWFCDCGSEGKAEFTINNCNISQKKTHTESTKITVDFFFNIYFYLLTYLTVPVLNCGMQDFFLIVVACEPLVAAYGS